MQVSARWAVVAGAAALLLAPASGFASLPGADAGTAPRATPGAVFEFALERSCGITEPMLFDGRPIPTCGRPDRASMPPPRDRVRDAASGGSAYHQFLLGIAHWRGEGAPADPVRALMWLSLAAEGGHAMAAWARRALAAELAPEAVARAQRLARQWRAEHELPR